MGDGTEYLLPAQRALDEVRPATPAGYREAARTAGGSPHRVPSVEASAERGWSAAAARAHAAAASAEVPALLLVEDEDSVGAGLVEGLEYAGFRVTRVLTGHAALAAGPVDLILLDLDGPDLDGGDVCRRLRERSSAPIIVVTAHGDELDRRLLLEMGADDYVVKPFGFRELVARIRAVLRRTAAELPTAEPSPVEIGPLRVDRRAKRVSVSGREVVLTTKEFDLLAFLAEVPGGVRRREEIIAAVWDENWWGPTKTLDVHVATLRRKLGDAAWITTLRGIGYRLSAPERAPRNERPGRAHDATAACAVRRH